MATYCEIATGDPYHGPYHDREYGFPLRNDDRLFERLVLEINQAGLSWLTILKKRDGFRQAYDGFEVERVARYGAKEKRRLLADAGIIRNRLKIDAAITNAAATVRLRESGGLEALVERFRPESHTPPVTTADIPATSPESAALSKELKKQGFVFVGPTTVYALMQAVGVVDDHLVGCHRSVVTRR